ncbi:MAG: ABC transporter permease subunit [Anaerolineaceae bacterium]|nr:ABC transporter permease subunit [Anaerolineaceae bacterium]MDD4042632.1 ABC transporter permease subunit [Anaerolineaceae bacterium]MDD4578656.1 ABC transporter permease subunit [Anaerolineaceae bacterium]
MNTAVFHHEFHRHRGSVLIWSASLLAMLFIFMVLFPSFSADMAAMNQVLNNFPPELKMAFGLNHLDLATLEGYFGFCFIFCQLLLAIQAANYGLGLVSIEEAELTADFLLTKPLKRSTLLSSKILAAVSSLLVTDLIFWAGSVASIELFKSNATFARSTISMMLASVVIFQLLFFSIGLLISLLLRKVRSVTPWSLGLAFGTYVLSVFSGVFEDLKMEYLSPFKHFDPGKITQSGLDMRLIAIDIFVVLAVIALSFWLYQRRNIASPN